MNIPLKKRYQDWIAEQVSAGRYSSEIEAIEEALREQIERDEAEYFRERRHLAEEDIKAGRVVVADNVFFESLRDSVREIAKKSGQ